MKNILPAILTILIASTSWSHDANSFNVAQWIDSLPKYLKDKDRAAKVAKLTTDFVNCLKEKNGKIGMSEARLICGATLQASIANLGENLEKISEKVFIEKVKEQAVRNLSKNYLEQVITMPILSQEQEKSFVGILGTVGEKHTEQTFCEMAPDKCSPQLARDLLADKNEILKLSKKTPPKSIFERSKLWKKEYAELLESEQKRRQCPDGSLDYSYYALSSEVKKISSDSGLHKYTDEVLNDLYEYWAGDIKGNSGKEFDPFETTQSVHENQLFNFFKNAVESDRDRMRKEGRALLNSDSLNLKDTLKSHPFEVGQMLYQYPNMLDQICNSLSAQEISNVALKQSKDSGKELLEAIETGAVTPSNNLDDTLSGWLQGRTLKCEKIVETYKNKKLNAKQLEDLKKENEKLGNAFASTIYNLDDQIKGIGLHRITLEDSLGLFKGCNSPEYELYKRDIYVRSIKLFSDIEKNSSLRAFWARHVSATDDEIKKQKVFLLMGFMARLPTKEIPGVESLTQDAFSKALLKQFPEGTRPTVFFHDLEILVKDKDLPQCLMPASKNI